MQALVWDNPGFLVLYVGVPEYPGVEEGRGDGRVTRGQVIPALGTDAIRWPRSGWRWPGTKAGVRGNAMFPGAWGGPLELYSWATVLPFSGICAIVIE